MKFLKPIFKPHVLALMLMTSVLSIPLQAQTGQSSFWTDEVIFYTMVGLVFTVALLVLVVSIYVLQLLKAFVRKEMTEEQMAAEAAEPSAWSKLWAKWNNLKPLEQESDILLDHDYDGIRELDNHLPPWWKGLFYVTIVYGIGYILIFHVFETSPLQEEQYEIEMAKAEEAAVLRRQATGGDIFDENTVTLTTDPGDLADGKTTFERSCASCHKADGGGDIGPNLTDDYWIHGGDISSVFGIIKNGGTPGKGMISWEPLMSPEKMRNIASYILSLRGSNPPGAKAAEGDFYEPEEAPADSTAVNN